MQEKVITIASLFFFLLIGLELLVGWRRKRNNYRLNDAINSLSLGVMSQIIGVFQKILSVGIYAWVFQHFALFTLPAKQLWVWVSGLLIYDFLYYWLHRMGHETHLLWAAHVVHHQSENYNLTTALRQTSTGALFGWIFYLPLAVLGYPTEMFIVLALIDLLYQFWVHTEQINKLGWFDRVFCSPSNHRVHHAVNDIYLDKNYGGILILWDRLFGTFIEEREDEPVVYGTRSPLRNWNPLYANLEVYLAVAKDAWRTRNWLDKIRIWFMPPGWLPADLAAQHPEKSFDLQRPIYNPPIPASRLWYCLVQFILVLEITTHFLNVYPEVSLATTSMYAIWLVAGLWIIGGLMQMDRGYGLLETLRLLATMAMVGYSGSWFNTFALPEPLRVVILVACLTSLAILFWMSRTETATS